MYYFNSLLCIPHIDINHSFVGGGAVSKVDPNAMGLHPDWRKALAIVSFSTAWQEGDPASVIEEAKKKNRANVDILDRLAPGSATYFNEVILTDPRGVHTLIVIILHRHRFTKRISRRHSSVPITTSLRRLKISTTRRTCSSLLVV
jgi:hypothetical protein